MLPTSCPGEGSETLVVQGGAEELKTTVQSKHFTHSNKEYSILPSRSIKSESHLSSRRGGCMKNLRGHEKIKRKHIFEQEFSHIFNKQDCFSFTSPLKSVCNAHSISFCCQGSQAKMAVHKCIISHIRGCYLLYFGRTSRISPTLTSIKQLYSIDLPF